MKNLTPKLRTVDKSQPPYLINCFPVEFPYKLGKEIVYLLATKTKPSLEGEEWEQIFAECINAEWKPSNVGLDDVILGNTAWGAKTVKSNSPHNQKTVRLISGRNSPTYSFGKFIEMDADPNLLGEMVLDIWNERVLAIREKFRSLRTVVLIKSNDLKELVVFEFDTIVYSTELYEWKWNKNKNLEGFLKNTDNHKFTWQPHGSQFTIIEDVPEKKLLIKIRKTIPIDKKIVMDTIGFENDWIEVLK